MNRQLLERLFLVLAVLLCLACVPAAAQLVSGNLTGTILDATGASVPNATVVAHNDMTGAETTTTSTSSGEYHFYNLPVATYSISAIAKGFSKAELKDVSILLNVTSTANITLQVGAPTTTVEVSAGVSLDTTSAQLQNTFNTQQMMDLPSASGGSGVINLSLLAPGVGTSGAVGVGTGPTVGGQRPRNNNFTIEGIDNNSGSVTGPLVQVPNDAVAEFTFLTNQFGADFGHSSGGQFNQVVKSGTNQFHGSAYEYFINRNLLADDNLNAVQGTPLSPRYDNNRFGGTFGGPIKKNKLFFFVNYEFNPVGTVGATGTVCAPTAAGYNAISGMSGINQTSLAQLHKYLGTAPAASTPAACNDAAYPLVGPGNASLGQQNPATAVTVPIGLVSFSSPSYQNYENAVAALDYNISDTDSLRGRFILNRTGFIDTTGFPSAFYTTVPFNYYLATLSEFHTFSPSVVNEFRLGYNRYFNTYGVPNVSWPGLDSFPNIDVFELGGVNNTFGPDPNAPQSAVQNQYQIAENISWTKGAHSFKFGFDGWKQISPQTFTQRSRGDYEWSYLSDYLFDYNPDYLAQRSLGNSKYYGDRILSGFFASDTWKVRPNVALNLGVRYEYQTIPYSERLQTENAISNVPGLITFGEPQPQGNAIMPRIGIAYSPGTSGDTSIRAGYGLFYDVLYDNQGLLTLPPQAVTTVDVTGLDQGNFLADGGIKPNTSGAALTQAEARAGTGGYVPNGTRPETSSWNAGIQHVFHHNYTFETRYVGTHSVHLSVQDQLNRQSVVNASNALPLFLVAPSQAVLNSLTNTLSSLNAAYNAGGNIVPPYLAAGFTGIITAYMPWGNSIYHGLQNSLTRRFSNGLQMNAAYTWSHAIDDSTADVFSTYTTPRRPQDPRNVAADRSSSALDHRQRATLEALYDLPFFQQRNWFMKNVVGNWEFVPVYTYQTGTYVDVQSGVDSNLNGDSAGDRAFVSPGGTPGVGSGATPLTNSAGQTVAFLANNPNAQYIQAPKGTVPNGGRNTALLPPIDDIDLTLAKSFNITESKKVQFSARFLNVLNHPQYVGGYISDVAPAGLLTSPAGINTGPTSSAVHSFVQPQSAIFLQPSQAFSSNPRQLALALKFIF